MLANEREVPKCLPTHLGWGRDRSLLNLPEATGHSCPLRRSSLLAGSPCSHSLVPSLWSGTCPPGWFLVFLSNLQP